MELHTEVKLMRHIRRSAARHRETDRATCIRACRVLYVQRTAKRSSGGKLPRRLLYKHISIGHWISGALHSRKLTAIWDSLLGLAGSQHLMDRKAIQPTVARDGTICPDPTFPRCLKWASRAVRNCPNKEIVSVSKQLKAAEDQMLIMYACVYGSAAPQGM